MQDTRIKEIKRIRRHKRIRRKIFGTSLRPRLSVHRSLRNFYAQAIDDVGGRTLLSVSTLDKEVRQKFPYAGNVKAAAFLGELCAKKAKELGIDKVVLDRGGYLYHGRVKAFAEGLRKGGIQF
ncbi:MAG: 50S ribosomal protein L18 [Candidatus Omnitrophica bacterium]|nr:50S ribosomal protein L18 [Candidatus Omnitrophota bacterium]